MTSFFERTLGEAPPARLVDEDPDLFAGLPPQGWEYARTRAVVPVIQLERGRWSADHCNPDSCLGLLVLEGLLIHSTVVANQPRSEIIGPGDVLRPWEQEPEIASVPFITRWDVVDKARVAILDNRFVALAARWPTVFSAVMERAVRRSNWLAFQLAITDLRRVDDRLMLFFWHLADRWGHMGPHGVAVPVPVTHDVLAQLVCAQRPTVTSALKRLRDKGCLSRRRDKTWLLSPEPPAPPLRARERRGVAAVSE